MFRKTLNANNLKALGADRLAELLIEVSAGSADIKRRLRLELSHNLGPLELARDVRKRMASLRKSRSYVGWRKRKAFVKDLATQASMITDRIAPDDPATAFDLLWDFIELAPFVHARVDDSRGEVGDVFRDALARFEDIGPRAGLDPEALAERVWTALKGNDYGEFDGLIGLLAQTLGPDGLEHLKSIVRNDAQVPPDEAENEHPAGLSLRDLRRGSGNAAAERRHRLIRQCLQEIATAQDDVDAYIAQYTKQDLARPAVAADVAQRLLGKGRAGEALDTLLAADTDGPAFARAGWDAAYIAALTALDQVDAAQAHRRVRFAETLDAGLLRDYLKLLPDFDDVEAEEAALAQAQGFPDVHRALAFLLEWPDFIAAGRLVETRADELDGDLYELLTPAAEALRDRHPLAAVLLWRRMIDFALGQGRATRYGHAADHLMDCAALDLEIADYGAHAPHHAYLEALQERHARKVSFWEKLR